MSDAAAGSRSYQALRRELRESELFASVASLLAWDQETMMPPRGTPLRAEQAALLSQVVHERRTSERFGELLADCEAEEALKADPRVAANLREVRRGYERAVRLPTSLVREIAETTTHAQQVWRGARQASDFEAFQPWLTRIVGLSRRKAECLGADVPGELYDRLLEEYEPGARSAELEEVFAGLRARLTPLIGEIAAARRQPSDRIHRLSIPVERQAAFNARVAARLGFDFESGRLDTSTHPFCQGIGPGDTRITTRYREDGFFDSLSSTLHEAGHGLYEQNLPKSEYLGEPLSEATSLGIHESQSRLWENLVGRSRAFWAWALPEARREFGSALDDIDLDDVYSGMNLIEPGLIRVESDEATYNLHIMLRFDLERALLTGDLAVADLPGAWNERVRSDLGIEVPDDRRGCLQDVHWSMGAIGYFPTYSLGNLYAAQLWSTATEQLGDVEGPVSRGEFAGILAWLREHVHQHGRRFTAPDLCERITGEPLSPEPFLAYLEGKLRPLYGI